MAMGNQQCRRTPLGGVRQSAGCVDDQSWPSLGYCCWQEDGGFRNASYVVEDGSAEKEVCRAVQCSAVFGGPGGDKFRLMNANSGCDWWVSGESAPRIAGRLWSWALKVLSPVPVVGL